MGLNKRHIQYDCGIHIQDELFKIYTYTSPPFESIYLHTTVAHSFVLFFSNIFKPTASIHTLPFDVCGPLFIFAFVSRLPLVTSRLSRSLPALRTAYPLPLALYCTFPLSKCLNIYEYQKTLSYISLYGDKQTLVPFQSYDVLFRETRGGDSVSQKFSDWTRK